MSLFGSLLGDFDDDAIFGQHMRQMNNFMGMGSLMPDPFNMLTPFNNGFVAPGHQQRNNHHTGMFGFPGISNMNRLLNIPGMDIAQVGNGASFCSSSVISMSSGPDGRPQVYQATSSTKTGPGGVRETRKTVQDSRSGLKKMAIGHHIGERGHIIEREQNVRSGQQEEHQEYINLDEEEAEDFDREFTHKVRGTNQPQMIQSRMYGASPNTNNGRNLPAIAAPPASSDTVVTASSSTSTTATAASTPCTTSTTILPSRRNRNIQKIGSRRPLRTPTSSPLALTSSTTTSIHPHPYNASGARRNYRAKQTKQNLSKTKPKNK